MVARRSAHTVARRGLLVVLLGAGPSVACTGKSDDSATADGSDGGGEGGTTSPDADADSDGSPAADDCDDSDPTVHPGAEELCDGVDTDCDGALHPEEADTDADGIPDCAACAEAGYWALLAAGTTGTDLQAALEADTPRPSCDYSQSKRAIYQSYDLEEGNVVSCVYTGEQVAILGGSPEDDAMNIEHSWPRSEGAESDPANCDVHHLYPTMVDANSARESHPYGEVTGSAYWSDGGSRAGSGSGGTVFEPRDAHKGNAARSMLYVWIQYGYTPSSTQRALYAEWSAADPVTLRDQERDAATARYQGNHNPFVACPAFTERMLDGR